MRKFLNVESLLWLALALALAGSLKHLAAVFASVDGNHLMGWIQAVAIDSGLFALAYSIRTRKADRRTTKPLWAGVTLFTTISVYGNLAYGLLSTTGTLPTWLGSSRPYVLAASLPVLVLFLAELLSDDRQHAADVAEREARKRTKQSDKWANVTEDSSQLDRANAIRQAEIDNRRDRVLRLSQAGKEPGDIAAELDVSVRTIRRDIKALNGQVGVMQ